VLADLAKERDKRQQLEQQLADAQAAQQSQLDGIAKALGLKPDDTPPDPAALAAKVTDAETRATAAERLAQTASGTAIRMPSPSAAAASST
jgi:hypothetical protein